MSEDLISQIVRQSDWLREGLRQTMENMNMPEQAFTLVDFSVRFIVLAILSSIAYYVVKKIILFYLVKIIVKSKSKIDDFFLHRKVFNRLSHLAPAVVIYVLSDSFFGIFPKVEIFLSSSAIIYMIVVLFWSIQAALNALEDIYNTLAFAHERPIRGYMQLIHLLSYIICFFILLSYLFDVQVTRIFAGMGAMAAVLMLIFKDSILGLTAGIQLSANKMVRVGDWISMPSHNADGDVIEITLNTVKVQNWDRTITTIPTYALVSSPFINWRGMEESGGRRIKRWVNLDMRSVKFCTPEMLEKYKKIHHLKEYIENREKEIEEYNKANNIDETVMVNGRHMTNLGVFRKYLENYVVRHPKLNTEMIFLIRHLQPSEKGIPLEIYVFCKDKAWAKYEEIQADIFDHVLAVIPEFDLRVFQLPAGDDLREAISSLASSLKN
ncbi:mechanosensitive ion channel family protein [Natronoflexus pectinivorans]|uniref:Mechanosensing system component YbdG n=1 Tax=Natronoflexus pectinivorans TaxID=682526 RepID=A0A4V2RWB1_9BACT|nr:mechanosensitive ion channel domain-containing protein [Natronoflexus pectinivorans]TCO07635.1 miniconductance mechanosensitive channel [Natronoflexus pectinivorans]